LGYALLFIVSTLEFILVTLDVFCFVIDTTKIIVVINTTKQ